MRITTKMINNSIMNNINGNKAKLDLLDKQYTTGKKIQKPSDDPIVAVRALKLRTTVTEVSQYLEKNIPDASSWMGITESALTSMNDILTSIYTDLTKGANDTLSTSDRSMIAEDLLQLKQQIYQEGNANFAGRYVLTGFKTDSCLTFPQDENELDYTITQNFGGSDIENISRTTGGYSLEDYNSMTSVATDFTDAPVLRSDIYRVQLGYSDLDETNFSQDNFTYTVTDILTGDKTVVPMNTLGTDVTIGDGDDRNVYDIGADDIVYIPKTGELIFGENVYENLRLQEEAEISITYGKTTFESGDVKPEHYYSCSVTDGNGDTSTYEMSDQRIDYEINFSQKLQVNTQIKDVLGNDFGRTIEEIVSTVEDVSKIEKDIANVENLLADVNITTTQKETLELMKEQLETQLSMKNELMTNAFETGLSYVSKYQSQINVGVANLGSRMARLELVENRLSSQKTDYTELLSENEDADITETYINLTSAETMYNASLSAAAKVSRQSLIDFL